MFSKHKIITQNRTMPIMYKLIVSILVVFMIVTINSFVLRKLFINELTGRTLLQLNYSINSSDNRILGIKNMLTRYITDADISFISNCQEDVPKGESLVRTLNVINEFSKQVIYNNILENIYLYFYDTGWVINKSESVFDKEFFFNNILVFDNAELRKYINEISYPFIIPKTLTKRNVNRNETKVYNSITYVVPISSKSVIFASINSDRFIDSVYLPEKDKGGFFLVADYNNNLVTYNNVLDFSDNSMNALFNAFTDKAVEIQSKNIELDGKKYIVFFKYSLSTNLKYYIMVPSTMIYDKILIVNILIVSSILFSGIIIYLIYFILKKDICIPFTRIQNYVTNLFPDETNGKNNMEFIYGLIEKLHEKNTSMLRDSEKQKSLIDELFIRRIIEGNVVGTEIFGMDTISKRISKYFMIYLYLEIYDETSYDTVWSCIKSRINSIIELNSFQINSNEMYCIADLCKNNIEVNMDFKNILMEIVDTTMLEADIHLICGISREYSGQSNMKKALDESKNIVLYRCENTAGKVFEYKDIAVKIDAKHPEVQVSLSEEMMLAAFISAGNVESVVSFFKDKKESLQNLPFIVRKDTYMYLLGIAFAIIKNKLIDRERIENTYTHYFNTIEKSLNLQLIQECVETLYNDITENIKAAEEERRACRIGEYINNNYFKNDFCLGRVAEEFGVSVAYLSTYFKKINGQSFSNYVNNLKVERAKMLLSTTSLDIKDISNELGFNHPKHFIRFFKQSEGTTPGNYRKLLYL